MHSLADSQGKSTGVLLEIAEYRPKRRRWLGHFIDAHRSAPVSWRSTTKWRWAVLPPFVLPN